MKLGELSPHAAHERMSARGIAIAVPPITVRLRSPLRFFASQFHAFYSECELVDADGFADVDIRMFPLGGVRRMSRPRVQFIVDGVTPFDPFPLANALPMFEWGLNWVFSSRMNQFLLLHSSVVEREGNAILFPAWPGSGKSTLAASLVCRGWRLLSDEFGIVSFASADVVPFVRPIALKNESIEVMRTFAPDAYIGPVFRGTRKGDVAHMRPTVLSTERGRESARVAAVVFPDFHRGEAVSIRRLERATAFLKLAGNAFNYEVVGERGFEVVASIMRRSNSYIIHYGDLADAHSALEEIMREAFRS
jgi:HprK-related kinase A